MNGIEFEKVICERLSQLKTSHRDSDIMAVIRSLSSGEIVQILNLGCCIKWNNEKINSKGEK